MNAINAAAVVATLPSIKLAKGTWLYHGTSVPTKFREPTTPAFFSRARAMADEYARIGHMERDQSRGIEAGHGRVLLFSLKRDATLIHLITSADFERLVHGVGFPDMYGRNDLYTRFWGAVCALGVDGWLISGNVVNPTHDDIMLCRPGMVKLHRTLDLLDRGGW